MPLSEEYKRQIRENLDMEEGGRLHALAKKVKAICAPVLIVGLGGTGVDALLVTKKLIRDSIECERTADGLSNKPRNIEYLAVDTDAAYERKSHHGVRLNRDADEMMIYTMADVSPILKHPEMQPPYIQNWLNPEISEFFTVPGPAGAVRQIGRLMLMGNLGSFQQVLNSKILRMTKGFPSNVPLYVFILAGISGGTGSGMFLDVPYLIKETAAAVTPGRVVQNIGLLFLPDVNTGRAGVDENKKQSIYANGYAALKELNYLMDIENTGDRFEQEYGKLKVGKKYDIPYPPYDECLLLSGKDKTGRITESGDEAYQEAVETAAEMVFNFVLGGSDFSNIADFPMQYFLGATLDNINTYKSKLGNDRRPVAYDYNVSGVSLAKLPTDELISYLTYRAFREIEGYWNRRPADENVDEVMKYFRLSKRGIVQAAKNRARAANLVILTFRMIKDSPEAVVQICEVARRRQERVIADNISNMVTALEGEIRDKNNIIHQYFLDPEKGPAFAQQCLYSTNKQAKCVINELINMANTFISDRHDPDELEQLEQKAAMARNRICNGNIIFGRGRARDEYVDAVDRLYRAHFENVLYAKLAEFCQKAADMFTDENNRIYGNTAELLEELVPRFQKYEAFKSPTAGKEDIKGERISWYLAEPSDFIREVEKRIDTDPAFAADMQQVIPDFYRFLFENAELWTGDRNNVVEHINEFIYEEFRNILGHSTDFFLAMTAEAKGMTLDGYCDAIVSELCAKAEIHFLIDETAVCANAVVVPYPEYFFIAIPDDSPRLYEAVRRKLMELGMIRSIVQKTGVRNRVFTMKIRNAVPLCCYADLKMLCEAYKRYRGKRGLHLYEPNAYSGIDWGDLPSPYPETEWIDFEDKTERQRNDRYREILRKALRYGYVTADPEKHRLACYWGETADYRTVLEEYGIEPFAGTLILTNSAKRAVGKIRAQLEWEGQRTRLTEKFVRDNMATDGSGKELKKDYMEMAFIQMFKVRDEIRAMVENHEECLRVVEDIRVRMIDDSAIQGFVLGRILGMIRKKALQYSYTDPEGVLQPFCELSARQMRFSEYYLFDEYMCLEGKIRADFEERANAQVRRGNIAKMRDTWQQYRAQMVDRKLKELEKYRKVIEDGEKIFAFYRQLKDTVDDLENMFRDAYEEGDEDF